MKEYTHYGTYGLIIKDNQILLIKKHGGPYDGKLDLPGGSIEFGEKPEETMIREIKEETGVIVKSYSLFDANSVLVDWKYSDNIIKVHHIGIFYIIDKYGDSIRQDVQLDSKNNDSLGASFYNISELKKENLSDIVIMELEKLDLIDKIT